MFVIFTDEWSQLLTSTSIRKNIYIHIYMKKSNFSFVSLSVKKSILKYFNFLTYLVEVFFKYCYYIEVY